MVFLANLEQQQMYNALKEVYNPMRPHETQPFPPFEEWQGISDICSHVYCRCVWGTRLQVVHLICVLLFGVSVVERLLILCACVAVFGVACVSSPRVSWPF